MTSTPLNAAILSLLAPGLGQIRSGATTRGLTLFLLPLLASGLIFAHALAGWPFGIGFGFVLPNALLLVFYVACSADAARTARKRRDHAPPDVSLRPVTLSLLFAVGVLYPVILTTALRTFVLEAVVVPTGSMFPTIGRGDRLLVDHSTAASSPVLRGEIVLFRAPGEQEERHLKRVIALPGETFSIERGIVHIDGRPLPRDPAPDGTCREHSDTRSWTILPDTADFPPTRIPPDTCFLLGDSRTNSRDSRTYGPVPLTDILGRARWLFWGNHWGRLD